MTTKKIVRLRKGSKGRIDSIHPWIYKSSLVKVNPGVSQGDIVAVLDGDGKFIGRGYYNIRSDITVRLLTRTDEDIDRNFFEKRISASYEKRKTLLNRTNAYRAVFSEADGLPGLIADIYDDTTVFQMLTLGMEKLKPMLVESIRDVIRPKFLYEKSESPFRKLEGLKDIRTWWGVKGRTLIEIQEGRVKFLVDIEKGHKTGFYLDQRRSRMAMENISKDKKVLDLFCYTGGFGISAAVFGASEVKGIDIKDEWLSLARDNATLNSIKEKTVFVKRDAFKALRDIYASSEKFDIIVLDPPSFAREKESLNSARKGYKDINLLAMKILNIGGILTTFSCSYNMPNEVFSDALKAAARDAGKKITILKRCHQSEDHPIMKAIPETEYLKGYFLKVEPD
jgi:23S rRNA (cytosine1962-C5)-methyltransferase